MKKEDLNKWYMLYKQVKNGYHMEPIDWRELIRLNHLIMEATHEIHNNNMLKGR